MNTFRISSLSVVVTILILGSCQSQKSEPESTSSNGSEIIIAFGSCAHQNADQPIFNTIADQSPDLWIWLGDIVYGDTNNMDTLRAKYDRQKAKPEYQQLIESTDVIGVWDDHDYGVNDGGINWPMKRESQQVLLDYLDVPIDDPRRSRDGAYSQYDLIKDGIEIKIILLDTRYFRDTLAQGENGFRYTPNEEGDVLGEEQWSWLETTLYESRADLNIIGSGIQFLSEEHFYEKWANFPAARQRMINLLATVDTNPVVLLSGDRHISEVSKMEIESMDYPIYDFTSSGLTHTWGTAGEEANKYRIGDLLISLNFGILRVSKNEDGIELTSEYLNVEGSMLQKMVVNF